MKSVTLEQIMAWQPCPNYPRERVEELMDGREVISPEEIAELDIDADSILWALLHREFLQTFDIRELACDFSERIAIKRDCAPALDFIASIRKWNRGEIADKEFEKIRADYWAADWRAYWGPYSAAYEAAYRAAYGAANTADERLWQIQHTLERIRTTRD